MKTFAVNVLLAEHGPLRAVRVACLATPPLALLVAGKLLGIEW